MKQLQCHPVDDINKWINPHRWTTFEEMAEKKAYKIQASVQYANHQLSFQSHVGAFQKSSKIGHQWKLDKYQHHTVVYWVKLPLTVFNWNTNHSWNLVNPLHPNIIIHILHTFLYKFPWVLTRKICSTIKLFCGRQSFPLFLFDSGVILLEGIRH